MAVDILCKRAFCRVVSISTFHSSLSWDLVAMIGAVYVAFDSAFIVDGPSERLMVSSPLGMALWMGKHGMITP